jgi:hypothetical protein
MMNKKYVSPVGSMAILAASVFGAVGCGSGSSAAPVVTTNASTSCYETQYGCLPSCTPTNGVANTSNYTAGGEGYVEYNGVCGLAYIEGVGNSATTGTSCPAGTPVIINGQEYEACTPQTAYGNQMYGNQMYGNQYYSVYVYANGYCQGWSGSYQCQ